MYYIVKLSTGATFVYNGRHINNKTDYSYFVDWNLPPDCVAFTIVNPDACDENGIPYCFTVKIATKVFENPTTKTVLDYDSLNEEFYNARTIDAVLSR